MKLIKQIKKLHIFDEFGDELEATGMFAQLHFSYSERKVVRCFEKVFFKKLYEPHDKFLSRTNKWLEILFTFQNKQQERSRLLEKVSKHEDIFTEFERFTKIHKIYVLGELTQKFYFSKNERLIAKCNEFLYQKMGKYAITFGKVPPYLNLLDQGQRTTIEGFAQATA